MAGKTINPTRMELTRLKAKQKTALRGHKLLKDKRDGLMKQFMQEVRRTRQLRKRVEEGLAQANAAFTVASAVMSPEMLEQALMAPRLSTEVTVDQRNIMSIAVPVFHRAEQETQPDLACYGFAQTSGELDDALQALNRVYSDLLELAQAEKTVQLLAQDIERTRRRVNALEYVVIPENQRNIRYITMKLEENERGNTTRLMKVKDMVLQTPTTTSHNERSGRLSPSASLLIRCHRWDCWQHHSPSYSLRPSCHRSASAGRAVSPR